MAIHKASRINESSILGVSLKHTRLSGTVKAGDGTPLVRTIYAYKVSSPEILYSTISDSKGYWSISIPEKQQNEYRVICVGEAGENDQVFDHVIGAS